MSPKARTPAMGEIVNGRSVVTLSVDAILSGRMLIQANSGWGKSWAMRRLLEETHGHVQQIVLDWEGEFGTLREKFDYLLCAASDEGDVRIDVRSARLLARKLLELGTSAVIDLYELELLDRVRFVSAFTNSMLTAPKALQHPVFVVIDEAQVMCPEKITGSRETRDALGESQQAVINLCSQGRKRGFAAILATQRISRLSKDAAAECNTKLIGHASLDIDIKRCADELGIPNTERFIIRSLEPGEFFAFGLAFGSSVTDVERMEVGSVQTSHPSPQNRQDIDLHPPPRSQAVKEIVTAFADLPEVAAKEEANIESLQREVNELRAGGRRHTGELERARADNGVDEAEVQRRIVEAVAPVDADRDAAIAESSDLRAAYAAFRMALDTQTKVVESTAKVLGETAARSRAAVADLPEVPNRPPVVTRPQRATRAAPPPPARSAAAVTPPVQPAVPSGNGASPDGVTLKAGARRMLATLAAFPSRLTRNQLGTLANVSARSGTFSDYLSSLRSARYLDESEQGTLGLTPLGFQNTNSSDRSVRVISTTQELVSAYQGKLKAGARRMLDALVLCYPAGMSRADLGEASDISVASGTFSDYLSSLRRNGLLDEQQPGEIRASETLFIFGAVH